MDKATTTTTNTNIPVTRSVSTQTPKPEANTPRPNATKQGDYFLLSDVDLLPPPPPKPKPPPPKELPPIQQNLKPVPPGSTKPTPLTVWERQAYRNAERIARERVPRSEESRPKKPTIWERHAARKAMQERELALKKEREDGLKEKESRVVHGDLPPPPRLSLIPAFRAFFHNREVTKKEEDTAIAEGRQPIKEKPFDYSQFHFRLRVTPYEVSIGAIGGLVVGIEAGNIIRYSTPPEIPIGVAAQAKDKVLTPGSRLLIGSTAFRILWRATFSGIMFSIIEYKMREVRRRNDWKNSAYAGFIMGSFFGLQALSRGSRGVLMGALGFSGFASLAAYCKYHVPPMK